MNNLPEGPRGKILAVAICFLLAAAIYIVLISPLAGLYESGADRLQERVDLVQRLRKSTGELPRLRQAAEALKDSSRDGKVLLGGSSDTVAAASLQSTMKDLVERGGARLSSAEILPSEKQDQFQRVGVHVAFSGDLALLTTVLRGIETARPVIFVDNVDIHDAGSIVGAEQDAGGQTLTIAFDLYGFRLL